MARPKKGQKSIARIEVEQKAFEYLERINLEFKSTKIPTLPIGKDGKINISELAFKMDLDEGQRKNHLYKDYDIINEINKNALIQNLKPIGGTNYKKTIEEDMKYPIDAHSKRLKESNEQLIEIQSQNTELLIENKKLKERILQLKECIEEYYSSGIMPDIR